MGHLCFTNTSCWFPFWVDRVLLLPGVEVFAAIDFVFVEAVGFWADTPEEPTGAGFNSHLWLSAPEPELADVFTEVGEIIWLPPFVSRNLSWSLSKVKHKMAYLVSVHYLCLFESRMGTNCWLKLIMFYAKQCLG